MRTTVAALVLSLLLGSCPAWAVVIVTGTGSGRVDELGTSGNFPYALQGDGNALVFGVYADNNITYSNAMYGGASPDAFVSDGRVGLFYFANPAASGNFTFDVDVSVADAGYFLYELDYVDTSSSPITAIDNSITTTADSQFVLNYAGLNFGNGAGTTPAAGSIISSSGVFDIDGGAGGGALAYGSGFGGGAGVQTLGWDRMNGNDSGDVAIALFGVAGGPTPWNVNGGGSYNSGANWLGGAVPADNPFFSSAHATDSTATVTLDAPVSLSEMTFSNANQYEIAGPSALTLTGGANILVGEGTHEISAVVAGGAGLTKSGGGALVLSGANTYTGTTSVSGGALQLPVTGSVPGAVSVAEAGTLAFVAGFDGAFPNAVSGAGSVLVDSSLTTETVGFNSAKTYTGTTQISGGTLQVSHASALGAGDATTLTGTTVSENGSQNNGKLALSGNVTVANELLTLFPRRGEGVADLVHVTSAGNNTWSGNIKGDVNGDNYNFESTSGTLTLGGTISAPDGDGGVRNFVFSGAGNIDLAGRLVDYGTDENGMSGVPINEENNVNVIKRGSGTLTINTKTDANDDYWFGSTTVESGTLRVNGAGDNGELRSDVQVNAGATLDVSNGFSKYNLIPIAPYETGLSGGGTVVANRLGVWESSTLSPGDGVGTLSVNGGVDLFYFDADEATVNNTGSLNFQLGDDATVKSVGNSENDLISVNGAFTIGAGGGGGAAFGSEQFVVNVTIAEGVFDTANNYTLIDASTLTLNGGASASNFQVNFTDTLGNVITGSRYSAAIVLDTAADEVQLDVDGTPVSLTWTGANGQAWDIQTTANWTGGDTVFANLDQVTFNDSAVVGGPQAGDFNSDGSVDAADYTIWRDNLGQSDDALNGNGTGDASGNVVQADYDLWRDNYGQTGGGGGVTVDISGADVFPSQVIFDSSTGNTYTITGDSGFGGATPINITGNVTAVLRNNNTLQGAISIGENATLDIGGDVSGNISGSGTLVVGSGFNTFSSANSLTGPVVIQNATLNLNNAQALGSSAVGTTISAGGDLTFNFTDLSLAEPLTFNGGSVSAIESTATLTGAINVAAGGASFRVANTGGGESTMTINQDIAGTQSGPVTLTVSNGLTMSLLNNVSNNGVLTKTGAGTVQIASTTAIAAPEIAANGGTIDVTAQSSLQLAGGQTLSGKSGTIAGNVSTTSGAVIRIGDAVMPQGPNADYIDATWGAEGNTTLASGAELNPPNGSFQGNDEWAARAFGNNGDLLQGAPTTPPDEAAVPVIKTTITGLEPNTSYDVYANFWDNAAVWPIQAGASEGSLTLFNAPGDGLEGATDAVPLDNFLFTGPVMLTESDRTMYGAPVGSLVSNGAGEIEVFIDDTGAGPNGRTLYDGITLTDGSTSAFGQSFTVDGDLSLVDGSTIQFDIANAGVNDLLTVTGALSVADGFILEVSLDASVSAASLLAGDSWNLFDFGSASGVFDEADFILPAGLAGGLEWDTSGLLTTGSLSVVATGAAAAAPEPATAMLLLSIAGLAAGVRRRAE
ncbi:Autotransporter-associated beta strand repeat protein [Posidoniimonas corsicana]|uniref:Autotransporter-associated beta strand repeat protein n=1 Tax=Posidoniimonas corsicana TaxID=1938618 RepID=A0A5C5UZJ8_9BACT|nr:autotransporter-associated beta strand repeat-containing protein [Posidoniimonas corsicana]TWT31093.1 Autotransporter-associated beta strand repeat protein [Posidoniimonas corsicana]